MILRESLKESVGGLSLLQKYGVNGNKFGLSVFEGFFVSL
jgi:hypothetical protein